MMERGIKQFCPPGAKPLLVELRRKPHIDNSVAFQASTGQAYTLDEVGRHNSTFAICISCEMEP